MSQNSLFNCEEEEKAGPPTRREGGSTTTHKTDWRVEAAPSTFISGNKEGTKKGTSLENELGSRMEPISLDLARDLVAVVLTLKKQ